MGARFSSLTLEIWIFPLADMCEHCLCPWSEVDIGKETKIFFLGDYKILKEEKHC